MSDISSDTHHTDMRNLICSALEQDKAENIVIYDLMGKSSLTDMIIIASGRSHRHVGAVADHLSRKLKSAGYGKVRIEGLPNCDWVLIDIGDAIIHIFRPEVREFYNIERIWNQDNDPDHTEQSEFSEADNLFGADT